MSEMNLELALFTGEEHETIEPDEYNDVLEDKDYPPLDCLNSYLRLINKRKPLCKEEELALAVQAQQGDQGARLEIIERSLYFVVALAKKYQFRGVDVLDLIEEGNLGLLRALEKYDPSRGFRFATYAIWWVRQHIESAILNQSRLIRLPVGIVRDVNKYLDAVRKITDTKLRPPRVDEIARQMNMAPNHIARLALLIEKRTDIDNASDIKADQLIGIPVNEVDLLPEDRLHSRHIAELLMHCVEKLDERQRFIIEHRYGLNDRDVLTLEEIALLLNLSNERVRQIQAKALKIIRSALLEQNVDKSTLL